MHWTHLAGMMKSSKLDHVTNVYDLFCPSINPVKTKPYRKGGKCILTLPCR